MIQFFKTQIIEDSVNTAQRENSVPKTHYIDYLLILLVAFLFSIGFLLPDMIVGRDIKYELTRVAEYTHSLKDSGFPVRWSANLDGGLGQPIFIFYSPLFLFVSSIQVLMGVTIVKAVKISLFFFTLLGGIGMYQFAKRFFNRDGARLASFLFVLFPYKFVDLYMRTAFAEYTAMSLAPFVFLGIYLISNDKKFNLCSHLVLTVSGTLFALSHNLSLVMYTPLFICYYVFNLMLNKNIKGIVYGILSGVQIFLLSSFFILPALFETQFIQHWQLTTGQLNVLNNFTTLRLLFNFSNWFSLTPFSIIILTAIIASILFKKHHFTQTTYATVLFSAVFIVLLIFLMLPQSKSIWSLTFPVLKYLQFPWRLLSPVTFLIAFVSGSLVFLYVKKNTDNNSIINKEIKFLLYTALIIILISMASFPFRITKSFPVYTEKDMFFSEKNIRKQNMRATVLSEYRPVWGTGKSFFSNSIPIEADFDCDPQIKIINHKTTKREYLISLGKDCTLTAKTHYYPGWRVYDKEKEIPINIDKDGLITFSLPEGDHHIRIEFQNTTIRKNSNMLSVLGIIVLFFLIFIRHYNLPWQRLSKTRNAP